MKKLIALGLTLVLVLSMAGCSSTISQNEYDMVCAERDELKARLVEMQSTLDELNVTLDETQTANQTNNSDIMEVSISGDFVATVRHLVPDYCVESTPTNVAVVTLFQSTPFTIYVGELGEQLEVGKTYVFEVQTKENIEIKQSEYQEAPLDPETVISYYNLRIETARLADESEYGLDVSHLVFESNNAG